MVFNCPFHIPRGIVNPAKRLSTPFRDAGYPMGCKSEKRKYRIIKKHETIY